MKRFIFKIALSLVFYTINLLYSYGQQVDAGPDTVILKGTSIKIGPTNSDPNWCFSWLTDSMPSISDKKAPQPIVSPLSKSTYKVTAVGPDFSFTSKDDVVVDVKDPKVTFVSIPSQYYGFDDYGPNISNPWKSIKLGDFDIFNAITKPLGDYKYIYFKPEITKHELHSPYKAVADTNLIVVKPLNTGESELHSRFRTESGELLSKINIAAYKERMLNVILVPVVDQNDDEQIIEENQGLPFETAITAGADGIFQSIAAGDDTIVNQSLNTGLNGVCETKALGDDIPIIKPNEGKPNTICITWGINHFMDTNPMGDDSIHNDVIYTGKNGICDTKAKNKNGELKNIDFSYLVDTLNKIYKQAVVSWRVSMAPLQVLNYDFNRDNLVSFLDPNVSEYDTIIKYCSPVIPPETKVIFVVNLSDLQNLLGYTIEFNGPYILLFSNYVRYIFNTIAHELGHSLGLRHTYELNDTSASDEKKDAANLMHPENPNPIMLRKNQWDLLNP